jgi:hypothetical protein
VLGRDSSAIVDRRGRCGTPLDRFAIARELEQRDSPDVPAFAFTVPGPARLIHT